MGVCVFVFLKRGTSCFGNERETIARGSALSTLSLNDQNNGIKDRLSLRED